ncbi:hypothetical protein ACLUXJ_06200 [Lactobacillus porci]
MGEFSKNILLVSAAALASSAFVFTTTHPVFATNRKAINQKQAAKAQS